MKQGIYNKKILNSFDTERREVNEFMIKTAIKQGEVIGSQNILKAFVRDMFFVFAKNFPKALTALKFQYSWRFTNGILDNDLYPNNVNGVIFPQPDISIEFENKKFDQYIKDSFSLIIFNNDKTLLDDLNKIETISLYDNNIHFFDNSHPFMSDGKLIEWSSANGVSAVIIRPDKHVYGCCDNNDILAKITNLTNKLHQELI